MISYLLLVASASEFVLTEKIMPPKDDNLNQSLYGHAIALSRDMTFLITTGSWANSRKGAAYVFKYNPSTSKYDHLQTIYGGEKVKSSVVGNETAEMTVKGFGGDVRISSDNSRLFITAASSASSSSGKKHGAVIVYDYSTSSGKFERSAVLTPADLTKETNFGKVVDIYRGEKSFVAVTDSDKFVVDSDNKGKFYMFEQDQTNSASWNRIEVEQPISIPNNARFGSDIQFVDASTAYVAITTEQSNDLGAYSYKKSAGKWTLQENIKVDATKNENYEVFGEHLAMPPSEGEQNTLLITAAGEGFKNGGTLYILSRNSSIDKFDSKPVQEIVLEDGWHMYDASFCSRDILVLHDPLFRSDGVKCSGGVIVYRRGKDGRFAPAQTLKSPEVKEWQMFGSAVGFNNDCTELFVGAHSKEHKIDGGNNNNAHNDGALYRFSLKDDGSNNSNDTKTGLIVGLSICAAVALILGIALAIVLVRKNKNKGEAVDV